jgi:hypothetical protein
MRDGPLPGLALIDAILARGDLSDYHLAHSARADLCRRLERTADARVSYERALGLTRQEPERRFLERRLGELPDRDGERLPKKRKPIGKAAAPTHCAGQEPLPQPCLRPLDLPRIGSGMNRSRHCELQNTICAPPTRYR